MLLELANYLARFNSDFLVFQYLTVRGILAEIVKGARRHEQLLSFRDKLRKTMNNWFRFRRTFMPTQPPS